jgi:hypothetical protein
MHIVVRIAAPISLSIETNDKHEVESSAPPHPVIPFRQPEMQRLIEAVRFRMSRSIGNPTSSPRALHVVSSQHISTLHNTSGTYILGC